MKITLISEDRGLYQLCHDALANTQSSSWTLSITTDRTESLVSDFRIWDVDSKTSVAASADLNPSTCLFMVDRYELNRFRRLSAGTTSNILLKPVTRATLTAFFDLVFKAFGSSTAGTAKESLAESLLQTNLGLQKYDQERSAFLASVAHDMRAPATALLGYCGLLLDRESECGDDARKSILRHMQDSASRLSRMISAIFELSVELQNAHRVDLQAGDVSACVDQAWHEVALIAADKNIAIDASIESIADLYFDRALLERVLINIFENACRFTPVNGRIEVRGYPFFWERRIVNAMIPAPVERRTSAPSAPNSFRVDILNSGPPIPAELLDYIFEQYVSLEEPSRARWGCGLGLAICRTIITQHRGRIWAQNTESGPKFCFVLPAGRPKGSSGDGMGEGWQANQTIKWQKESANASI